MARDRKARPEARPLRLFVAVDIPGLARRELARRIEPLRAELPNARWVTHENWHVTLKFLGSVYPRLRQWVGTRVRAAAESHEPFSTRITELGAFPSPRRARVLWAGLDDSEGRFSSLAAELDRLLEPEFEPDERVFTAHLTVARFREQASLPADLLLTDVAGEPFSVDALTLYRSHLQRPAARYEALERIRLESPARGA